ASLEMRPATRGLMLAREADDHRALRALARSPDIVERAANPAMVRLLWEVCQIPDFRKVMSETHARLLAQIYRHLSGPAARLPTDWVANQVARLDRGDGDIDTLMTRIAHIRTWTYIANRPEWLADAAHWEERARAIEDRLSDALHDRITQRFVDRRSAFLVRQLASARELLASVSRDGEVKVEGHFVGRLEGFRFVPDTAEGETRTLLAAANRVLRGEIAARARELAAAGDGEFALGPDGTLLWRSGAVGRLAPGERMLAPKVEALPGDFLEAHLREGVRQRLAAFVAAAIERGLGALFRARAAELKGAPRGLVFQLGEALGGLPAREVAALRGALTAADRKALARLGVRLGTETVYFDALLKPKAAALKALLWAVRGGSAVPAVPGGTAAPRDPAIADAGYAAMGFAVLGPRVLRFDRLERLAMMVRRAARQGAFAPSTELAALAGCALDDLAAVLPSLGYRAVPDGNGGMLFRARARRFGRRGDGRHPAAQPDGPFAKLRDLRLAR
ncbi:MAG TPA: disulfide oxidoreductase, partial [Stellaceae bacterium]|nr:disulfide oxidoreductase [Stellaceae bacterium]